MTQNNIPERTHLAQVMIGGDAKARDRQHLIITPAIFSQLWTKKLDILEAIKIGNFDPLKPFFRIPKDPFIQIKRLPLKELLTSFKMPTKFLRELVADKSFYNSRYYYGDPMVAEFIKDNVLALEKFNKIVFSRLGHLEAADILSEFVFFFNIFVPYEARLMNIYRTDANQDALGEIDLRAAISSIAKFVGPLIPEANKWGRLYAAEMLCFYIKEHLKHADDHNFQAKRNDGLEYEKNCQGKLTENGFLVTTTPRSGDFGADIIAESNELIFAIQCKDFAKSVGVKAIQEAIGSRRHYGADFAVVVTEASFTAAAIELASTNDVILSNLQRLPDIVRQV